MRSCSNWIPLKGAVVGWWFITLLLCEPGPWLPHTHLPRTYFFSPLTDEHILISSDFLRFESSTTLKVLPTFKATRIIFPGRKEGRLWEVWQSGLWSFGKLADSSLGKGANTHSVLGHQDNARSLTQQLSHRFPNTGTWATTVRTFSWRTLTSESHWCV